MPQVCNYLFIHSDGMTAIHRDGPLFSATKIIPRIRKVDAGSADNGPVCPDPPGGDDSEGMTASVRLLTTCIIGKACRPRICT